METTTRYRTIRFIRYFLRARRTLRIRNNLYLGARPSTGTDSPARTLRQLLAGKDSQNARKTLCLGRLKWVEIGLSAGAPSNLQSLP